jgi:Fe-S cluster assembly protein SufB
MSTVPELDFSRYQLGWSDDQHPVFKPKKGLNESIVREMSEMKGEEPWMRDFRLKALKRFEQKPMLPWFAERMPDLDFNDIYYYVKPIDHQVDQWEDLPADIRNTYERLGIPEAERKYLAGVTVQYESDVVLHRNREDLARLGVLFCDMDTAVREYPEIVRKYFGTIIPPNDNKFAALNSAVWSGGSFIYVPPGVKVDQPLQAYFRINSENMGQFERTLIIADEGAQVHYIEGCLLAGAPIATGKGGWVPIEQVNLGSRVQGVKGTTKVTTVMKRDYDGSIHRIVPLSGLNEITVTSEHPILAVRRADVATSRGERNGWKPEVSTTKLSQATPEWLRADELQPGDFMVFPRTTPKKTTPLHPAFMRLAGYYLAGGTASMVNGCKALTFSFHEDEVDYIEEVRSLCEQLWGKRGSVTHIPYKHSSTVTIYTKAGYDTMKTHVGSRSWSKQLSTLLFGQSEESLEALVGAYVNGDGDSTQRAGGTPWVQCHTTSALWAMQLQSIMARLGTFATVRLDRPGGPAEILGRQVTRHDLYMVQWTVDKKATEVRQQKDLFLVPIKKIETTPYTGTVYNIETEDDTYVVNGFRVHNCSAPVYTTDSLHSAVVELIALPGSRITYTTIQNWSNNVYNLVTKRARAEAEAHVEWIDGNIGSRLTMKYPSVYLMGPKASGEVLSVAYAGAGQVQDAGAKMIHVAPETTSTIISKSISKDGGTAAYRGLVKVEEGAKGAKSFVRCDALILDEQSTSETRPYMEIGESDASVGHEATVSKIGDDQLFYLMARGLNETQAMGLIVNGFIEPVTRALPMEYAVEWSRLIELQMEGSIG